PLSPEPPLRPANHLRLLSAALVTLTMQSNQMHAAFDGDDWQSPCGARHAFATGKNADLKRFAPQNEKARVRRGLVSKAKCGRSKRTTGGAGGADGYPAMSLSPTGHVNKVAPHLGARKLKMRRKVTNAYL